MIAMKKPSQAAVELIKASEGLRLHAYLDSVGVATIGYGHITGTKIGDEITEYQADKLLAYDIDEAWRGIQARVSVPLSQGQVDALTDFVFNFGEAKFRDSTLLAKLNRRDYVGAGDQLKLWVHADGKVLPGLVKRRAAEKALWDTPDPEEPLAA